MVKFVPNREGLRRLVSVGEDISRVVNLADPALLRALGTAHVAQEQQIFSTEGAAGASGPWPPLSPRYAARKRRLFGRRKILERTGAMKAQFTRKGDPAYFEHYEPAGDRGVFSFGARSKLGAIHVQGGPFLPVRNMIEKTAAQLDELREVLKVWYFGKLRQLLRGRARLGAR